MKPRLEKSSLSGFMLCMISLFFNKKKHIFMDSDPPLHYLNIIKAL